MRFPRPSELLRHGQAGADAGSTANVTKGSSFWSTLSGSAQKEATTESRDLILAAFETSYEAIARYIALRIGERDSAEDMASEVFVKALRSADSFKADGKPIEAWLFKIAKNLIIDHHRRNARRATPVPLEQAAEVPEDDTSLDNLAREDDATALRHAMKVLTDSEREVIAMRFAGELSPTEIANSLGKSPGAVRWLQHSAISKLRERLRDSDGADRKVGD